MSITTVYITTPDNSIDVLCRYRAALQAKKERTTKAAASFGPKVKHHANPKEVYTHSLFTNHSSAVLLFWRSVSLCVCTVHITLYVCILIYVAHMKMYQILAPKP